MKPVLHLRIWAKYGVNPDSKKLMLLSVVIKEEFVHTNATNLVY